MADIHQPLHANYQQDAGGNKYQVQFQGQGMNLHRVWDSGLLSTRNLDWKAYANMLDAEGFARLRFPVAGPSPAAGRGRPLKSRCDIAFPETGD